MVVTAELKRLYNDLGEPTRIRCYMYKKIPRPYADYITVVYTHANRKGYPIGRVLYRGMSGNLFHHVCGVCQWGEGGRWSFRPGGSRVNFSELPEECREVVMSDYKDLWGA